MKFRDDVMLPYDERVDGALEEMRIGPWKNLKQRFPGISIQVMVNSITPSRIRELVANAKREDESYRPPNFLTYFVIDLPVNVEPRAVIKALRSWQTVETAYFDPPAEDAFNHVRGARQRVLHPYPGGQGYLEAGPQGIDARFAWGTAGGKGKNSKFIDLEQGWTLDHVDLIAHGAQLKHGDLIDSSRAHGTSVLGIACADPDLSKSTYLGIAPNIGPVNVVSHSGHVNNIPNAIAEAITLLSAGDVLLLEVQRPGYFPTEIFYGDFNYIELATRSNITVIEAAGNGGLNLDALEDDEGTRVFAKGARHSGAIMVGAGCWDVPHQPMEFSNYGNRVDCYAWGENVFAPTSAQSPYGANFTKTDHNPAFDGTSSAAAIIAGAALVLQGVAKARSGGQHLKAGQLRSLFRDESLATKSANPGVDLIGVMPDLRKVITSNAIGRFLPIVTPHP